MTGDRNTLSGGDYLDGLREGSRFNLQRMNGRTQEAIEVATDSLDAAVREASAEVARLETAIRTGITRLAELRQREADLRRAAALARGQDLPQAAE